jgi:hypothetical protein
MIKTFFEFDLMIHEKLRKNGRVVVLCNGERALVIANAEGGSNKFTRICEEGFIEPLTFNTVKNKL